MTTTRKAKILVVDDSTTVLIMGETLLRRSYQVLKATGGTEALRIAAVERPDLILLDFVMPKMDGLETCRLLRGMPATQAIPIIMVTTRGDEKTKQAAMASGATDFLTKPIDARELHEKIERYLGVGV